MDRSSSADRGDRLFRFSLIPFILLIVCAITSLIFLILSVSTIVYSWQTFIRFTNVGPCLVAAILFLISKYRNLQILPVIAAALLTVGYLFGFISILSHNDSSLLMMLVILGMTVVSGLLTVYSLMGKMQAVRKVVMIAGLSLSVLAFIFFAIEYLFHSVLFLCSVLLWLSLFLSKADPMAEGLIPSLKRSEAASVETAPAEAAPAEKQGPYDDLIRWKELLDQGAITQEEFDARKKELLGL